MNKQRHRIQGKIVFITTDRRVSLLNTRVWPSWQTNYPIVYDPGLLAVGPWHAFCWTLCFKGLGADPNRTKVPDTWLGTNCSNAMSRIWVLCWKTVPDSWLEKSFVTICKLFFVGHPLFGNFTKQKRRNDAISKNPKHVA